MKKIFLIVIVFGFSGISCKVKYIKSRDEKIYDECKKTITEGLKVPSTAKFAPVTEAWFGKGTGKDVGLYIVNSHVDAQNTFGVFLRSKFMCKVKVTGEKREVVFAGLKSK